MAISKEQPMRSAEIALIDAFNTTDTQVAQLTNTYSALSSAVQSISDEIGSGFDDVNTISSAINANASALESLSVFEGRFKFGIIENVTIAGNASTSDSETFETAFPAHAACIVFPMVITDELSTLFSLTIIDCTNIGFSYSVSNSDADEHTVNVGYIAINVA